VVHVTRYRIRIYRLSQAEFRAWREHETRAELTKRIFTEHGVAQIRAPCGHILGTARQSNERVPIERAKSRAAHHAIRPGECMCREWQKPPGKEDEHHPICVNKASWESQQAHDPDAPRDRVVVSTTVAHAAPSEGTEPTQPPPSAVEAAALPAAAVEPETGHAPASVTPEPATCICQVWAGVSRNRRARRQDARPRFDRHDSRERNLAPAVVVRLSQLPANTVPVQRLLRLSALVDDESEPDEASQLRLFKQMLASPTRRGRRAAQPRTQKEMVWQRFQRLRQGKVGIRVDPVYQPFLDSLLKYLAGENKGLAS
jgi:hypothetical protein